MPSILIADDHPLFRAALHRVATDAVADLEISEADDFDGVMEAIEQQEIDLLLLDLHMPGNHGLAGLASIRARNPGLAVVIVSANEDLSVVRRAFDLGAAGYLPKSSGVADLREAQQYKVLDLVAQGLLNKQIADRMGISLRTVKAHMTRIMDRLGVRSRTQAIRVLHEFGISEPTRSLGAADPPAQH